MDEIYNTIPHREPFLFIDSIQEIRETGATTKRLIRPNEPHFQGHYPENPIMPGVLLCEAVFQTAAIFLVKKLQKEGTKTNELTPVLSRIKEVKFKHIIKPGDTITINAQLIETIGQFHFIKGTIRKENKLVLSLECTLALINENKPLSNVIP